MDNIELTCGACRRSWSGNEADAVFFDLLWPNDPRHTKSGICRDCLKAMPDPAAYRYGLVRHLLNAIFRGRNAIEIAGLEPSELVGLVKRKLHDDGTDLTSLFPEGENEMQQDADFDYTIARILGDRALQFLGSEPRTTAHPKDILEERLPRGLQRPRKPR